MWRFSVVWMHRNNLAAPFVDNFCIAAGFFKILNYSVNHKKNNHDQKPDQDRTVIGSRYYCL